MRKTNRVKQRGKATVTVLAVGAPAVTVGLAMIAAKLISDGLVKQERLSVAACVIAGAVAFACGLFAAARSPKKKLLWGMSAAMAYLCMLLLGNLLFFGEGYGGVLSIFLSCVVGGLIGSVAAAGKKQKYA